MNREIHPDWLPPGPGARPSPRPQGPNDAERAHWWRTNLPQENDVNAWLRQLAYDIATARWERAKYFDYGPDCPTLPPRMAVLPAPAFAHHAARRSVTRLPEAPARWNPPNAPAAWSAGFAKRLSGHAEPWRRETLRAALDRNELPSREDQIVCNRILRDIHLAQWLQIAVEHGWTIERLAEITRNAGCSNHEICAWLNRHADASLCPPLNPPPVPETPLKTWERLWYQPIIHATSGPTGELSGYELQTNTIKH